MKEVIPGLTVLKNLRLAKLGPGTISKATPLMIVALVLLAGLSGLALWKGLMGFAISCLVLFCFTILGYWVFTSIYTWLFPNYALLEGAELSNVLIQQAAMGLPAPPENPSLSSNPDHADPMLTAAPKRVERLQ